MALPSEPIFEFVLGTFAFGTSFFTLKAFFAFRGDVMQRMFGFLSAALLLVGGLSASLILDYFLASGKLAEDLLFATMVSAFVLLLLGLIPLVRWAESSRQSELHGE
jgi:ABC-type transport system involved in cytochrome c biogenesis permease subunit